MAPFFLVIAGLGIVSLVVLLTQSSLCRSLLTTVLRNDGSDSRRSSPCVRDRAMSSALTTAIIAAILGSLLTIAVIIQLVQ